MSEDPMLSAVIKTASATPESKCSPAPFIATANGLKREQPGLARMRKEAMYEAQIAELQQKLESSCRRQHEIENILEEYEVAKNRQTHQAKEINKKFYELQKKYVAADKERKEFALRVAGLEKDKKTVTERWVRATSQAKQDDKQRSKMKGIEKEYESLKNDAEESHKQVAELSKELGVLKTVIETKDELLSKYTQGRDLSAIEQSLNEKISKLDVQVSRLKKENEELSGELIIKRDRVADQELVERELEKIKAENVELIDQVGRLETELESEKVARVQDRQKREKMDAGRKEAIWEEEPSEKSGSLRRNKDGNSEVSQVLISAHTKMQQMSDCIRKLQEQKAVEGGKYDHILSKYQRSREELSLAEGDIAALKRQSQPLAVFAEGSSVLGKENIPAELNYYCSANQSIDDRTTHTIKADVHEAFVRRASALLRPSSAIGHKVINLPPAETTATEINNIPMTARGNQAEKVSAFKSLMRKQCAKSNLKGRTQVSLGDTKTFHPSVRFVGTPSAGSRLQPRGFNNKWK